MPRFVASSFLHVPFIVSSPVSRALVALGSNVGDRRGTLAAAVAAVGGLPQTTVVAESRRLETAPVGGPPGQDSFLNGALVVETSLAPEALLRALLDIETALGRVRDVPWGPRTIDLDLLLYDDAVVRSASLTLPHPRLAYRKFILGPAAEIAGSWRHPLLGRTLGELALHLERTPRYAAFVGRSHGFRSQLAAEAADAARARLVEPTDAGVPPSVEALASHGHSPTAAIEFLDARAAAVRRSLAEADGAWVVDDAWLAAEFRELAEQATDDTELPVAARRSLTLDVTPRLLIAIGDGDEPQRLAQAAADLIVLPPVVAVEIADREAALTEIAAALEAAT